MKKELIESICLLDNCWGHHQDGSDLIVTENEMFDALYNKVMPRLKTALKYFDLVGDAIEGHACSRCGLNTPSGGSCIHCSKIGMEMKVRKDKK
tara:strand:+ start:7700 stop:7981 length:282 start_codon:yes stop_codon:yes gene_type:complete